VTDYEIEVPHTLGNVQIRFDSTLNENPDNESYGFNRFSITTAKGYGGENGVTPISGAGDKFQASKAFFVYGAKNEVTTCGSQKLLGGKDTFG
jgi:hypothetical protein